MKSIRRIFQCTIPKPEEKGQFESGKNGTVLRGRVFLFSAKHCRYRNNTIYNPDILSKYIFSFRTDTVSINGKQYNVIRILGEGGFSYVYLVRDPSSRAQFALKRLRIQLKEHEAMFKREVDSHQKVSGSRHIITLVDSALIMNGNTAVEGLLLLPFFSRGTCQDLMDRSSPSNRIPLIRILSLTADICRGMRQFLSSRIASVP